MSLSPQHNNTRSPLLRFIAVRALEHSLLIDGHLYLHHRATFNNCRSDADLWREIQRAVAEANRHRYGRPDLGETADNWRYRVMRVGSEKQPSRKTLRAAERREAITALKAEGKSHREIAFQLGTTKGSIDVEVHRMRKAA